MPNLYANMPPQKRQYWIEHDGEIIEFVKQKIRSNSRIRPNDYSRYLLMYLQYLAEEKYGAAVPDERLRQFENDKDAATFVEAYIRKGVPRDFRVRRTR